MKRNIINKPNNFKTESWERKWLLQILKTDFKTNTLIAYDVVAKKIRLQICITTKTINTHKKITNWIVTKIHRLQHATIKGERIWD